MSRCHGVVGVYFPKGKWKDKNHKCKFGKFEIHVNTKAKIRTCKQLELDQRNCYFAGIAREHIWWHPSLLIFKESAPMSLLVVVIMTTRKDRTVLVNHKYRTSLSYARRRMPPFIIGYFYCRHLRLGKRPISFISGFISSQPINDHWSTKYSMLRGLSQK